MSEVAIAARVVAMLIDLGCDVYQEVAIPRTGDTADIVALRGPEVWIVETKTSWSLDLIKQCMARRHHAHRVFAAAPDKRGVREDARICRELRIGAITVPVKHPAEPAIIWEMAPRLATKRASYSALRARLAEGHKTHAPAGSPGSGGRFTPYTQTCEALAALVARQPGITLKVALERITHHYASMQSARGALAKWIEEGKVPGVQSRVEERRLVLYPGCSLCDLSRPISTRDPTMHASTPSRYDGRRCSRMGTG